MYNSSKSILFFLLICFAMNGQQAWYHYKWDSSSPSDFGNVYDSIYKFNINRYKQNIYIGEYYDQFSKEYAAGANFDVQHGYFYKSLEGYESYIRKVLDVVIADPEISKTIKIYFYKDPDLNATMDGSGVLRLNIGILARLKNEAELAFVLGHEVAHFLNEDAIKGYGREIEMTYDPWMNFLLMTNYGIIYLNYVNNPIMQYMWHSREQESSADFTSLKFLKKTNYSLKSASNLFKLFKRCEIKGRIMYGKHDKRYGSHPDPGDRIKQIKILSADSLNKGKRNYVVDSVAFNELKKICFQETANLYLTNFEYDELTELCFNKYLFEPENKHNLAILIEAISRNINNFDNEKIKDKSFILHRYQTKFVKESENYEFLNLDKPSVLRYLNKGFIELTKEDLPKIKAHDLMDTSAIEFTTNAEALDYFKKKAEELSCMECKHYNLCHDKENSIDPQLFLAENSVFETTDFISDKQQLKNFNDDIFIVYCTDIAKVSTLLNRKTIEEQNAFYNSFVTALKTKFGPRVFKMTDMKYKDQDMIAALTGMSQFYTKVERNKGLKRKDVNWTASVPELYSFFKRNNVKNLYVIDFDLFMNRSSKANEFSSYYKVALPSNKGYTFSAQMINNQNIIDETSQWFMTRIVNQAYSFYTSTK